MAWEEGGKDKTIEIFASQMKFYLYSQTQLKCELSITTAKSFLPSQRWFHLIFGYI